MLPQSPLSDSHHKPRLSWPSLSTLTIAQTRRLEPNRHGPAVYEQVFRLAQEIGLVVDSKQYHDHVSMSAYLWPHTSFERLFALTYFNVLGYYINDTIGRDIRLVGVEDERGLRDLVSLKAFNILLLGATPTDPDKYDYAFLELDSRFRQLSVPGFSLRLYQELFQHWKAATVNYEMDGAYNGSVEEFIKVRRVNSGMIPTIQLIELARQAYLPDWLPPLVPSLATAVDALADTGALSNEIFSYTKEVIVNGTTFNLIPVIQRQTPYKGLNEAVHYAIEIVNERYAAFRRAVADTCYEADRIEDPARRDEALAFLDSFIGGMEDQAAACYHWQMEANRYRNPASPFPELRPSIAASIN